MKWAAFGKVCLVFLFAAGVAGTLAACNNYVKDNPVCDCQTCSCDKCACKVK